MGFNMIDQENWNRKEYFDHYYSELPCTYSMTVKLDIKKKKKAKLKLYPTMLYYITKVVNQHKEFRTAWNQYGLGVYDNMLPCYTVFHKDTETFSNIWTEFTEDYTAFCNKYESDMEQYGSIKKMNAKPNLPDNSFTVSMIPWTTFEGFHLNIQKGYEYLLPIFTIGKFYKENGNYLLPFSIQVHHAVCDGFHVCRFVNELQELLSN